MQLGGFMRPLFVVLLMVSLTILGDYLLKIGSAQPNPYQSFHTHGGALLYFVSAYGWIFVMQRLNLTTIGAAYSSLTIIALTALSIMVFREAVGLRQIIGAGLAVAAVVVAAG
jgi:multidrug transporter EmrE-like cation transporter